MRYFCAPARLLGPLFSVAALLLMLGGCANKPADTTGSSGGSGTTGGSGSASDAIVIGEYASMTGAQATFGTATDKGIQLAVSQINAAGGIDGHQVKIGSTGQPEDDQGQPDGALTAVKKLITQDKAIAILGEVASKNSIAAAPFCNSNKVPMISPSSTNPKVTQTGPYIFRVCFIDPFQGTVAARFMTENLHAKTRRDFIRQDKRLQQRTSRFLPESLHPARRQDHHCQHLSGRRPGFPLGSDDD